MDINTLVFKDNFKWIMQCLNFDICTQADSLDEVIKKFKGTLHMEMIDRHGKLNTIKSSTPEVFNEIFQQGFTEKICTKSLYCYKDKYKLDKDIKIEIHIHEVSKYVLPYMLSH